jgi:hypothetical protein
MRYFLPPYHDISLAVSHYPFHILSFFARPQKLGTELQRINKRTFMYTMNSIVRMGHPSMFFGIPLSQHSN